jgi:hypothetical protein
MYQKLKGAIVGKGKTYEECARGLGISVTAFSNKINGKAGFKVEEAAKLSELLDLTKEDRVEIFLN